MRGWKSDEHILNLPSSWVPSQSHLKKDAVVDTAFLDEIFDYSRSNFSLAVDLEDVDAVEHFFWGMRGGLALELGAEDGSIYTHSMTSMLEEYLGWRRILIEGNPKFRAALKERSPNAVTISAAVSDSVASRHFSPLKDVGGLIDAMTPEFLSWYHHHLNNHSTPFPEQLSSVDWTAESVQQLNITRVQTVPLQHLLDKVGVRHIHFFILDVEGSELNVLRSLDFGRVSFDVIAVETSFYPYRPKGYSEKIINLLHSHGYELQFLVHRNLWFKHISFLPSSRPDMPPTCFSGVEWAFKRRRCPTNATNTEYRRNRIYQDQVKYPFQFSLPAASSVTPDIFYYPAARATVAIPALLPTLAGLVLALLAGLVVMLLRTRARGRKLQTALE